MKKICILLLVFLLILCTGCARVTAEYDIAATTLPVYDFTVLLCQGTDLRVGRLVTENVSCLHDYTLQVSQLRMIEDADALVISGAGLEDFLEDMIHNSDFLIDASVGTHVHTAQEEHDHEHTDAHGHQHENDPHIWLSPKNAAIMAKNICDGLIGLYPEYSDRFQANLEEITIHLEQLQTYGNVALSDLTTRELITFHDGFAYLAESFGLTILETVEEESGSEASAAEIIHLVELVESHNLPALFTEISGSTACAGIIEAETGVTVYTLDMAMSGDSYFDAMYHNINTLKEALG